MAENPKQVGDIRTLVPEDRLFVKIDGVRYYFRTRGDLGLRGLFRVQRLQKKIDGLQDKPDDLTEEEIGIADEALNEIIGITLIDCPKDVIAKLGEGQKLDLTLSFMKASRSQQEAEAATKPNRAQRRSGASRRK